MLCPLNANYEFIISYLSTVQYIVLDWNIVTGMQRQSRYNRWLVQISLKEPL